MKLLQIIREREEVIDNDEIGFDNSEFEEKVSIYLFTLKVFVYYTKTGFMGYKSKENI